MYKFSTNQKERQQQASPEEIAERQEEVAFRLKKARQTMEYLRARLAIEKEQLAKERMRTSSFYMQAAQNANFQAPVGLVPNGYAGNTVWRPQLRPNDVAFLADHHQRQQPEEAAVQPQYGVYKEQLEKIDTLCEQELKRMERSVSGLRQVRRCWNDLELDSGSGHRRHHHQHQHHQHRRRRSGEGGRKSRKSRSATKRRSRHDSEDTSETGVLEEDGGYDGDEDGKRHHVDGCRRKMYRLREGDFIRKSHFFTAALTR